MHKNKNSSYHNTKKWLKEFTAASKTRNGPVLRSLRVEIIQSTIKALNDCSYTSENGVFVEIDLQEVAKNVKAAQMFDFKNLLVPSPEQKAVFGSTKVEVLNIDCLEAALALKEEGTNPLVLNLASASRAGGGYLSGAGAQEENLFRRTNYRTYFSNSELYSPHRKWKYPIPACGGCYCPNVLVMRSSEATGYAFLDTPVPMGFLAVAASRSPRCINKNGQLWLCDEKAEATSVKMNALFRIALEKGHDTLVLSALGCGAYKNPPHHIAKLFHKELSKFNGCFKKVVFAILDDHNAHKSHNPDGNFAPFATVFSNPLKGST